MTVYKSPMSGVPMTLQSAATTGNGTAIAIPSSFRRHKLTIVCSAGVSAGAIQPETAKDASYAGTWAPLGGGPITVPAASTAFEYTFEGIFAAFRARISTTVADGTVTVTYEGGQ